MSDSIDKAGDEYADEKNMRFVRWQALTLEQLGATSNMVLGLGTGLLAVLFTFMVDDKIKVDVVGDSLKFVLSSLGASIGCAVGCAMTRLQDFRGTKEIARRKLQGKPCITHENPDASQS